MNRELKSIAVLGGRGFLGSNLVNYFKEQGYEVTAIDRNNYQEFADRQFDLFVNANGNSKRFWADQNPEEAYKLSVKSAEKSFADFKFKKYVYISSSDVYPDHHDPAKAKEDQPIDQARLEPYGLHKFQAEQLVKNLPHYLILRCSAMIGRGLKKGVVRDLLDGVELFVTLDSRLQFITTTEVGRCVLALVASGAGNEIFNCGGKGSIIIGDLGILLGRAASYRKDAVYQAYEMGVQKLDNLVKLKSSEEYLRDFLKYENQVNSQEKP